MQKPLMDRTAIVTGASRGIGKEIALKLGNLGASVVVNYARNAALAEDTIAEIIETGAHALPVRADVQKVGEVESLFDKAIEQYGRVDILVNNAGTILNKKVEEMTEGEFDTLFAINVKGVFFGCQQAARRLADGGRIINISSSVTKLMMPTYGAYAATKGAVEQITKVLAKELGSRNITVNAISPGPVDTDLFREGKTDEQIKSLAHMSAFGRLGTPIDIANAIALLMSDEAGWITGQNICVNGGFTS